MSHLVFSVELTRMQAAEGLDEPGTSGEPYYPPGDAVPTAPPAPGGQTVFDADH